MRPRYLRKSRELVVNCPNCLLYRLFKRPSNAHHFTNAFHAAAQQPAHAIKLLQIPTRDLDDAVIQTGFETCRCHFRDGILDFIKWDAQTEFCCDERKRIACRF